MAGYIGKSQSVSLSSVSTGTVETQDIQDGAVTNVKVASGVDAGKLTTGTLPIARIADGAITDAKIDGMSSSKLSGALPAIDGSALTGINIPTVGYGAFQATFGTTGIAHATSTKVPFSSELSDYDNLYDPSNYRYTPDVAGTYYINAFTQIQGWISTGSHCQLEIWKNGTQKYLQIYNPNTSEYPTIAVNAMVTMNGTTDYLEIYIYQASGSTKDIYGSNWGKFEGYLVRAA